MIYIVFGATQEQDNAGRDYLYWGNGPIGVFSANTPDDACKMAAKKQRRMGTYFACAGTPWGLDLLEVDGAFELGNELSETDARIKAADEKLKQLDALTAQIDEIAPNHA